MNAAYMHGLLNSGVWYRKIFYHNYCTLYLAIQYISRYTANHSACLITLVSLVYTGSTIQHGRFSIITQYKILCHDILHITASYRDLKNACMHAWECHVVKNKWKCTVATDSENYMLQNLSVHTYTSIHTHACIIIGNHSCR